MIRVTLSVRLLLLAVLPALTVGLLAAAGGALGVTRALNRQAEDAVGRAAELAETEVARLARTMHGLAVALGQREDVVRSTAAGDRERLLTLLRPVFEGYRAVDARLRILEVTDGTGRVLVRAHNPPRHGDAKATVPDVAMALSGQVGAGSVVSPATGEVATGAAVPLRLDGQIIGTLKTAGYLDTAAAREIVQATGAEVVLVGAGRLRETTIAGLEIPALPPEIQSAIRDGKAVTMRGSVAGIEYGIAARPLRDIGGAPAGALIVLLPWAPFAAITQQALAWIIGATLLTLVLAGVVGALAARRLARPLGGLAAGMTELAAGRPLSAVPGMGRSDEIGRMARAVQVFRSAMDERTALEAAAEAERAERDRRHATIAASTRAFGASISDIVASLGRAADEMRSAAAEMGQSTARTREGTAATTAHAQASAQSLGAVAVAAEQLASSVGEIARRVAESTTAAGVAVERAGATDSTMRGLSAAAGQIGDVVRLIADIAGRTNLLALNATIEAARAGDAGKGFAVVASEVKQLADQTAKATSDITDRVSAIQGVTGEAVAAIGQVASAIGEVSAVSAAIAASVEQQGAATAEISERVHGIARRTEQATQDIAEVARIAEGSGAAGQSVLAAAGQVGEVADLLRMEVDRFLAAMQATEGEAAASPAQPRAA